MSGSSSAFPIWAQITVGSGGVVGLSALLFNLFKQVTDAKDAHIRGLQNEIELLQSRHENQLKSLQNQHDGKISSLQRDLETRKEEIEKIGEFRELFTGALEDLASRGITAENNASLRRIESHLASMQENREVISSMRTTSRWVEYRRKEWVEKAMQAARKQYPDLLSSQKSHFFKQDIESYLSWLQESLFYGFFCRIEDYVKTTAVDSPFPYRAALQALRENKDYGQLSTSEVQDLQDYMDELIRCVS